ncbi:CBS domain-containing protein [Streptacidiphilus jiangxiensis]|uniref:CBS domain-containing protein n=1 Tax=Streptacidiphilus jiangxiensis TaxID=235985 RepID=A0A1H7QW22_STRJI|nr:CBS domain-containing protein [Streptacidiphilus jiangxiensis]SEL51825.1 CBS domain-containing protein [Streptacidiphilus jiangxiensis]
MSDARDLMHTGVACVREEETLATAARRMRELDVGALPVCGADERLHGIITDRDIVIRCVADGMDPNTTTAGALAQGKPLTVDVGTEADEVLELMAEYRIRRMPVIENHRLVGMITEADLSRHLGEWRVGHFVEAVCATA